MINRHGDARLGSNNEGNARSLSAVVRGKTTFCGKPACKILGEPHCAL